MKFTRSDVFEMVDALFHAYASYYRTEAKEDLADMMQRRENSAQPAVGVDTPVCSLCSTPPHEIEYHCSFCPDCGRDLRSD